MAAVLGLDATTLREVCAEATDRTRSNSASLSSSPADALPGTDCVVVANDNAPGQIVISGAMSALELAMEIARERGAKRVLPLSVSGAFHSPVMMPAARGLAQAVAAAPLVDAGMPLIANRNALPITSAADLRAELAEQVDSPVQWTGTIEYLVGQGVQAFVEIGAGQVLSGLIRRIARGVTAISIATAADIAPVAEQLRARLGV
jgi:[acyl-carrier-protein] S-malonyltransferase